MNRIGILALMALLGGCRSPGIPPLVPHDGDADAAVQCDLINGYCVSFGDAMNNRKWTDHWTGLSGYPTDHTLSNGFDSDDPNHMRVDFYSDIPCSPFSVGISDPVSELEENGAYRMWGEVDQKNDGSFPEPNCRVKSVYPEKNPTEHLNAYALCFEKQGETVLICVSQAKDDPKLAWRIFETFRWER